MKIGEALVKVFGILKPFLQKGFKPPEGKSFNQKRDSASSLAPCEAAGGLMVHNLHKRSY
ncbi:hypothetical protein D0S45_06235 [Marinifilum sp. JC120]|nr:hypothetical protein D0S45_06235 [Marinifilum sp. JC120]